MVVPGIKMGLDIKIKEKKAKDKSPLDINGVFPGYINKNVFRGVILIMVLFTVFVYLSNGSSLKFGYYNCPAHFSQDCINSNYDAFAPVNSCEAKEYFKPGETCGEKPNLWALYYNRICLLFVWFGFMLNHLFYMIKTGEGKPPFNRDAWNKHPLKRLVNKEAKK